ncbi:hypothetical protein ACUN7V_20810 [Quadrisphaera oryzae]|uniref:hypothetical protein n=1 Tax=Quadrisphaera TaxID=317661 RepID=UPI00164911E0|nr:hypothetical protein [Quadrisphaera sp. RL12-1S]MBC3760965.1 hypothetical protein [Quadrisphaera sp. RL12-1S]
MDDLAEQLLAAVHRAVSTRPAGSAAVGQGVADPGTGSGIPLVHVTPRAPGAAHIALVVLPDEVTVTFGGTHVYLGVDEQTPTVVEQLVEAVLAGRFVERGPRADAFAEVTFADGERWSGGDALASLWPKRSGRRSAPCT